MDGHLGKRQVLELLGEFQSTGRRALGTLLSLRGRGQAEQKGAAQLVMVGFIFLDRVALQFGGRGMALGRTEIVAWLGSMS